MGRRKVELVTVFDDEFEPKVKESFNLDDLYASFLLLCTFSFDSDSELEKLNYCGLVMMPFL